MRTKETKKMAVFAMMMAEPAETPVTSAVAMPKMQPKLPKTRPP